MHLIRLFEEYFCSIIPKLFFVLVIRLEIIPHKIHYIQFILWVQPNLVWRIFLNINNIYYMLF